MKTFIKLSAIIILMLTPNAAHAKKEKAVYRASNMTQEIEVIMGVYDDSTGKHEILPKMKLDDYKSWFEFSVKMDEMPTAAAEAPIVDFSQDSFIMIREKDAEGLVTRETMFTPGLIQLNVYEIAFLENLRSAEEFFFDLLEMQMDQASYGGYLHDDVDVMQQGVVIEYPISNILPNPVWPLKKPDSILKFMNHIDPQKTEFYEVFYADADGMERIESYTKKAQDIFIAHINFGEDDPMGENMPYKVYADDDGTLILKRSSFKRAILDKQDYYGFFFDYFMKLASLKAEEAALQNSGAEAQ